MITNLIVQNLPKIVGFIVPKVAELAAKDTPAKGEKLAKLGARLLVGGGAVATGAATITLPDAPDSWIALLQQVSVLIGEVTALVGAIMVLFGKTQTVEAKPE